MSPFMALLIVFLWSPVTRDISFMDIPLMTMILFTLSPVVILSAMVPRSVEHSL